MRACSSERFSASPYRSTAYGSAAIQAGARTLLKWASQPLSPLRDVGTPLACVISDRMRRSEAPLSKQTASHRAEVLRDDPVGRNEASFTVGLEEARF